MGTGRLEAIVLMGRERVASDSSQNDNAAYDAELQLWVNRQTRVPIVLADIGRRPTERCASQFGETTLKKTQEGADQSDMLTSSQFGETSLTKTQEGADQSEALCASEFGETTLTRTQEGADQSEVLCASQFGETTLTETREGADQSEISQWAGLY